MNLFGWRFQSAVKARIRRMTMMFVIGTSSIAFYVCLIMENVPVSRNRAFGLIHSFSAEKMRLNKDVPFIFLVPRFLDNGKGIDVLSTGDQQAVHRLIRFLEMFRDYDAVTCPPKRWESLLNHQVNYSWCRFAIRQSTLFIRNTGQWISPRPQNTSNANLSLQRCNIVEGPFLMRKETFSSVGWKSSYGKASTYDFFLRSKGRFKIAKLNDCVLSDSLSVIDRGPSEYNQEDFPDYWQFGSKHSIWRIVMEDRVEWTKCMADGKLCIERALTDNATLLKAIKMPLCCRSIVLDRLLRDVAWALEKVGMNYRIVFGTLLGAIRSQAIIPWTQDVDFGLNRSILRTPNWNKKLQELLKGKYYVGQSFAWFNRAIPLIPPHLSFNTTPLFDGPDDFYGEVFFDKDILAAIKGVNITGDTVRNRGYGDFYEAPDAWWSGSKFVTINGQRYVTVENIDSHLMYWYGSSFMKPPPGMGTS